MVISIVSICHVHMSMSLITQDGDSALMQAANTEVAVELVTAGANLNLQNAVCQL